MWTVALGGFHHVFSAVSAFQCDENFAGKSGWWRTVLCVIKSAISQTTCMNVHTLTSFPLPRCFQWRTEGPGRGWIALSGPFLRSGITGEKGGGDYMRECVLCPGGGGLGNAATPPSSPLWCWNWDSFQKWLILTRQLCSGPGMSGCMHQSEIWQWKAAIADLAACWSWWSWWS